MNTFRFCQNSYRSITGIYNYQIINPSLIPPPRMDMITAGTTTFNRTTTPLPTTPRETPP